MSENVPVLGFPEDVEVTEQAVFDHVLHALRKQGRGSYKATSNSRTCLYRGPDGTACAGGHLIGALYVPEMEEAPFIVVMAGEYFLGDSCQSGADRCEAAAERLRERFEEVEDLVMRLQHAHDDYLCGSVKLGRGPRVTDSLEVKVASWEQQMALVAQKHGLTYTPPGDS